MEKLLEALASTSGANQRLTQRKTSTRAKPSLSWKEVSMLDKDKATIK